jgi:hypothetical protein
MTAPWLTFFAFVGVAVLYVIAIVVDTFMRFRDRRIVHCPEKNRLARVQIDATLAAMTAVPGPPKLMVQRCAFWPDGAECAQGCTRYMT